MSAFHYELDMGQTFSDHTWPHDILVSLDLFVAEILPQTGYDNASVIEPDDVEIGAKIVRQSGAILFRQLRAKFLAIYVYELVHLLQQGRIQCCRQYVGNILWMTKES